MADNQFFVDLGNLKLTDQQRTKISLAIQRAVTNELAGIETTTNVVSFPLGSLTDEIRTSIFPGGGKFKYGYIIRDFNLKTADLNEIKLKDFLKAKVTSSGLG